MYLCLLSLVSRIDGYLYLMIPKLTVELIGHTTNKFIIIYNVGIPSIDQNQLLLRHSIKCKPSFKSSILLYLGRYRYVINHDVMYPAYLGILMQQKFTYTHKKRLEYSVSLTCTLPKNNSQKPIGAHSSPVAVKNKTRGHYALEIPYDGRRFYGQTSAALREANEILNFLRSFFSHCVRFHRTKKAQNAIQVLVRTNIKITSEVGTVTNVSPLIFSSQRAQDNERTCCLRNAAPNPDHCTEFSKRKVRKSAFTRQKPISAASWSKNTLGRGKNGHKTASRRVKTTAGVEKRALSFFTAFCFSDATYVTDAANVRTLQRYGRVAPVCRVVGRRQGPCTRPRPPGLKQQREGVACVGASERQHARVTQRSRTQTQRVRERPSSAEARFGI